MSRKPIIAGNWKMNKNPLEARDFVEIVTGQLPSPDIIEVVVAAPAVDLTTLLSLSQDSNLRIAAQNCYFADSGAFTGENSPKVLSEMGVDYVVVGHSERRNYFYETDGDVNKKVHAALRSGLIPIVCCGESLDVYEEGKTIDFVSHQVSEALRGLSMEQAASLVIAYEPVWAIGTGKSATKDDAQKMCQVVRDVVAENFVQEVSDKVRIQYGGSVNPENIASYMNCPDVDGALVGGASLEARSFLALFDVFQ